MHAIQHVLGALSGWVGWLLLAAGVAYSLWADIRFERRQRLGLCSRCGRQPWTSIPTGASLRMCARCTTLTNRNHRLGVYFFLGMAVLSGLSIIIGTVSDISRGYPYSWTHLLILVAAVGGPLIIGLSIRWVITRR